MVKTTPSKQGDIGSIPGYKAISHDLWPKNQNKQNIKQENKEVINSSIKTLKMVSHLKIVLKINN